MAAHPILKQPAFAAVRAFADTMLRFGRDDYGPRKTPLFAGQLNAETRRIPAGTADDPGLFFENIQIAGCMPACQNLMFDFGLLDSLKLLSRITGDAAYEQARQDTLAHFLRHCRHPQSGYFPWGDHVGCNLVTDTIHEGQIKGCHEVKVFNVPWDDLWAIDPAATRHEIEVALFNHICDERTFAFNRHANMNGASNRGGGPCSLASSAAFYLYAWAWLYRRTGERKFLDWANKINSLYWNFRSPTTNLFSSGEDRPDEMWYGDVLGYACQLLNAAGILGGEGRHFHDQALTYLHAYSRIAWDPEGGGFFDTINIVTGKPAIGVSKYYPAISRPAHLQAWSHPENSISLIGVAIMAGVALAATDDPLLRELFERALSLVNIEDAIARKVPMVSGDGAGLLLALLHVERRTGDNRHREITAALADYLLAHNRKNGIFTSGIQHDDRTYAARAGSADLAAALLAFAMAQTAWPTPLPPIRCPMGTMPW
ncbi:MAG: hypothetical protein HY343_05030 [Lentisphaerae bacterium]|nr:hypothetical protein [Lentisphaerota bacterium]